MRQLHRLDVVQTKGLKAGRIDQAGLAAFPHPIPSGAGGRVFARVQGARNFTGLGLGVGDQVVDQGRFAHARRAQNQTVFALQVCGEFDQALGLALTQAQRQDRVAHASVGRQARPSAIEEFLQVAFVEHDEHGNVLGLGGDQGAGELALGPFRVGGHQHHHQVQIGREGFGADLVLAVEQVLALNHALYRAFVASGLPDHTVTHHRLAFFAARVADAALPVGAFHQTMATVGRHHQTFLRPAHARAARCMSRPRRSLAGGWEW